MKKAFFFLTVLALISTLFMSCTKDTVKVPDSKTAVPDELVGKWQSGNFNIRNFSAYTGACVANQTNTIAYNISKDGSAEQYIYYDYNDGSDLQTCTYRKGTVVIDPILKTWKFFPASGNFRKFHNGKKTQDDINTDGLYPKYAPSYKNYYLDQDNQKIYLECTNEYDEDMSFQKVTW